MRLGMGDFAREMVAIGRCMGHLHTGAGSGARGGVGASWAYLILSEPLVPGSSEPKGP